MSLVDVNDIILYIYMQLEEDDEVESVTDFEENKELREYFNLTLVEV